MVKIINNGCLTLAFDGVENGKDGEGSGHEDGLRIQFYWPRFVFKRYGFDESNRNGTEFYFKCDTTFRFIKENRYWGIGGQILGFGIGGDYQWI